MGNLSQYQQLFSFFATGALGHSEVSLGCLKDKNIIHSSC